MRILVALGDEYRSYREVIAAVIKILRPHAEVAATGVEALTQEVARFDPQVIISSRPKTAIQSPTITWVKVPTDDVTQPTEFWLGERQWETTKPPLEMLLAVIDETEKALAQTDAHKNRR